jgi:hypothetical protein
VNQLYELGDLTNVLEKAHLLFSVIICLAVSHLKVRVRGHEKCPNTSRKSWNKRSSIDATDFAPTLPKSPSLQKVFHPKAHPRKYKLTKQEKRPAGLASFSEFPNIQTHKVAS